MNAIPLINNAPRPNINVGSIGNPAFNPVAAGAKLGGSIGGNVMRQNPASMPVNNETQLRQEVNTSIVALKREAFSLENLIAQAAQTLQDINKRLSELEGKQGDYVKKNDVVDSITSGNMNPVTSNAVATSNAMPVNSVTSGNLHSVTSNAVAEAVGTYYQSGSYSYTEDGVKMLLPAYVSSSSTSLVFMLPIIHDSDKTVTFTNIGLACRTGLGGYVEGSGARKINMTDYNFSFIDKGRLGIAVSVAKKNGTAWQNATTSATVTNNTGCVVSITDLEFSIS
jgi:hypothetical protein